LSRRWTGEREEEGGRAEERDAEGGVSGVVGQGRDGDETEEDAQRKMKRKRGKKCKILKERQAVETGPPTLWNLTH